MAGVVNHILVVSSAPSGQEMWGTETQGRVASSLPRAILLHPFRVVEENLVSSPYWLVINGSPH